MAKQSGREAAAFVISRCPKMFPLREPNPVSFLLLLEVCEVNVRHCTISYYVKVYIIITPY